MLKSLTIQNYALIETLEMQPSGHLNIITGETGAGKSIMLGAVGLLVGQRSDTKALLRDDKKCVVEGVFDIQKYRLTPLFDRHEIDFEPECIIRREISPSGKSRAFVNDTPVTLNVLKELGSHLLDVHSQHENLQLSKQTYQLEVLDAFAVSDKQLSQYQAAFGVFVEKQKALHALEQMAAKGAEDLDYKTFLLDELEKANLDDLDQDHLEKELSELENAEEIKTQLAQAYQMLEGEEMAGLTLLNEAKNAISGLTSYSEDIQKIYERIESQWLELRDIAQEIDRKAEQTLIDPEKTQALRDQLDLLYKLQKKHGVLGVEPLIQLRDQLQQEVNKTAHLDEEIDKAKTELESSEKQMLEAGQILREARQLAAQDLADKIEAIIRKIGIENGTVEIGVHPSSPSPRGLDTVDIRFSANKGFKPVEVSQVASGGEFSRLIFAIKYLLAGKKAMPTVIFDEIDTGVSGEIALQMADMMKKMSENHQVISISHLPQFAARGNAHYFVYKDHEADISLSKMRKLETEDRIAEIAKMIGGKEPSSSAYSSAKELMGIS